MVPECQNVWEHKLVFGNLMWAGNRDILTPSNEQQKRPALQRHHWWIPRQKHFIYHPASRTNIWPTPASASLHLFILNLLRGTSPGFTQRSKQRLIFHPAREQIDLYFHLLLDSLPSCSLRGEISIFGVNKRNSCGWFLQGALTANIP